MLRPRISETPFALYCWLLQVMTVVSLTSVVIYLSLKPRSPDFTITNVYIQALGGTKNSTLNRNETTSIHFSIQISNPNRRVGIYYEQLSVRVFSGEFFVGMKTTEAFYQGHKTIITREVEVEADEHFSKGITNGNVELRVILKTAVRYKIFWWRTKNNRMGFEGFARIVNGRMSMFMKIHETL